MQFFYRICTLALFIMVGFVTTIWSESVDTSGCPHVQSGLRRWSDADTWDGTVSRVIDFFS